MQLDRADSAGPPAWTGSSRQHRSGASAEYIKETHWVSER